MRRRGRAAAAAAAAARTGTTRGAPETSVTAAVVTLAAALLLLSLDESGLPPSRPDAPPTASANLSPDGDGVARQWQDFAGSGVLACLGARASSRATAEMNGAMRQARVRAAAEWADPRSAMHAAAHSSLVLFAGRSYDTGCRNKIEVALESVYADVLTRLGNRPSVWRGELVGDLVAGQRYGHPPVTFPPPLRV